MRIIDEDALIEEAESSAWDVDIKELQMILKYVPTIDAVEVIRCGECKYNTSDKKCLYPDSIIKVPNDDDYCSYGKKMGENK